MQAPFLIILIIIIFPNFTLAQPTINCHCFQDREYDPQRSYAADPYFLATTQNSFFAKIFDLHKEDVVRAKMGGVNGDNLWVGHYLSEMSGKSFDEIYSLFSRDDSWVSVVKAFEAEPVTLDASFLSALNHPQKLSTIVVDEKLMENLNVEALQIQKLRGQGADNKQTVMAVFLSQLSIQSPVEIFNQVKEGKASWGHLLAEEGLYNGSEIKIRWQKLLNGK